MGSNVACKQPLVITQFQSLAAQLSNKSLRIVVAIKVKIIVICLHANYWAFPTLLNNYTLETHSQ